MKKIVSKAIILKRTNFGEADRIIKVLTPDNGQISLFARGVRKSKSKLAGGLELFSISDITYIDSPKELKTIISSRLDKYFESIVHNLDRVNMAYDFLKYSDVSTKHNSEENLFKILALSLEGLNSSNLSDNTVYVWFALKLLSQQGSGINLEKPLSSEKFLENGEYDFSYEDMTFADKTNGPFKSQHVKFLRFAERSSNPLTLAKIEKQEAYSSELKDLALNTLRYTFGN